MAINSAEKDNKTHFRWTYIILPVSFFIISLILTACFYPFISDEIAYHFQNDLPDKWLSRSAFLGWMIVPQVFFAIISIVVVKILMMTSRYFPSGSSALKNLLNIMGNMFAIPQIVLTFAMIDFFLYNVHQIKLIPLWIFTLIVLILGVIVLGVFFIRAIQQSRRLRAKIRQE